MTVALESVWLFWSLTDQGFNLKSSPLYRLGILGQLQAPLSPSPVALRVEVWMKRTVALKVEVVHRCGEKLEEVERA